MQELPAQRQPGQPRGQPTGVLECGHTLGEITERDPAAGLARAAVHSPRELAVGLGGIGFPGEQGDRGGVVAEQERCDRRIRGIAGRNAVTAAVNGGDGVASQVAAAGEPPGLVQDPQRGARPGRSSGMPGWEGSAAPAGRG